VYYVPESSDNQLPDVTVAASDESLVVSRSTLIGSSAFSVQG
jgi:hypothetical protein